MSNKTNTQIGDRNWNIQISGFKEDLGIIDEIYKKILKKHKTKLYGVRKKDFVGVEEKIKLNIVGKDKQEELRELFRSIYDKISLIQQTFYNLDKGDQREIHIDIKERYSEILKESQGDVLLTLRKLSREYLPLDKLKNPKYTTLSKAFVLFFFDDCTIGRKNIC
jgi:hypothetical protein